MPETVVESGNPGVMQTETEDTQIVKTPAIAGWRTFIIAIMLIVSANVFLYLNILTVDTWQWVMIAGAAVYGGKSVVRTLLEVFPIGKKG